MDVLVVAATEAELGGAAGGRTLACGIGPVEAAAATARALAETPAEAVLHVGLAGARTLEPPALVLGSDAVYEDLAAAIPVVARVQPDGPLLAAARAALPEAAVLPIGTTARVGATAVCDVEAMEGFAVLRACALAGVPAVELRAVSNTIGEPDRGRWRLVEAAAVLEEAARRVVAALAVASLR